MDSKVTDHSPRDSTIRLLYSAFNARDADRALNALAPDVDWPNGWEGGRLSGREAVRQYWTRQWSAVSSTVEPVAVTERSDGSFEVAVRQTVRDSAGALRSDQIVRHVFIFRGELVERMDIEA